MKPKTLRASLPGGWALQTPTGFLLNNLNHPALILISGYT